MPFMPRRVVAATITVAALGAGAAPALATTASTTTTPLAVAIAKANGGAQRLAQREWVAGLLANAKGVTAAGKREVQQALTTLNRADGLTGYANEMLAGSGVPERVVAG
jgi:hypothetical protein